jgi:hypothetical protein
MVVSVDILLGVKSGRYRLLEGPAVCADMKLNAKLSDGAGETRV